MAEESRVERPNRPQRADDLTLRRQLLASFHDDQVHGGFEAIFSDIPPEFRGRKPDNQPFTLWRILEHLRLCIDDFLDYCVVPGYMEPPFPAGYWPQSDGPADDAAWEASLAGVRFRTQAFETLVMDPSTDLFAEIPGGGRRTILRQVLACLDHNSYHLGEAVLLRRLLGIWKAT